MGQLHKIHLVYSSSPTNTGCKRTMRKAITTEGTTMRVTTTMMRVETRLRKSLRPPRLLSHQLRPMSRTPRMPTPRHPLEQSMR